MTKKSRLIRFADKIAVEPTLHRIYMWYCVLAGTFLLTNCAIFLLRGDSLRFMVFLLLGLMFVALALFHRLVARVARDSEREEPGDD